MVCSCRCFSSHPFIDAKIYCWMPFTLKWDVVVFMLYGFPTSYTLFFSLGSAPKWIRGTLALITMNSPPYYPARAWVLQIPTFRILHHTTHVQSTLQNDWKPLLQIEEMYKSANQQNQCDLKFTSRDCARVYSCYFNSLRNLQKQWEEKCEYVYVVGLVTFFSLLLLLVLPSRWIS